MWGGWEVAVYGCLAWPTLFSSDGMWGGWAGCRGLICRVDTPPGPLHFDPGWGKRVGQSVSNVKCEHWYWGERGIFEKIKLSNVGSNSVAALGIFVLHFCDFQNCQSRACLCLPAWTYKYTAKTVYRKFETNNPKNETARPQSNSYIHVTVRDLNIPTIGLPILLQENRGADRGNI